MHSRSETHLARTVWWLALWAAVNAFVWMATIPFGEGPDEVAHFDVVAFEAAHARIPEVGVDDPGAVIHMKDGRFPYAYHTYSAQPGLSYIISAVAVRCLPFIDPPLAARLPGALYAALLVTAAALAMKGLFPGDEASFVLAAALTATWPQISFIMAYTNNDGYTILVATALMATWSHGVRARWSLRTTSLAGVFAGLVLLGKPNGVPMVAMTAALIAFTGARRTLRERVQSLAIWTTAVLLTAGWWYVIAYQRYGWDLFAEKRAADVASSLGALRLSGRSLGFDFLETAVRVSEKVPHSWVETTLRSAVGTFSSMKVPLSEGVYPAVAGAVVLATIGWVVRGRPRMEREQMPVLGSAGFMLLVLGLLSLWRSWDNDFQPQGRYLLPAFFGFLAFVSGGLARLVSLSSSAVLLIRSFAVALILMNILALTVSLVPIYFPSVSVWSGQNVVLIGLWALLSLLLVAHVWMRANVQGRLDA